MHSYIQTHSHSHTHMHVCIHTHAHTHAYSHTHMYTFTHTLTLIYIYTRVRIHTHTHAHIHTLTSIMSNTLLQVADATLNTKDTVLSMVFSAQRGGRHTCEGPEAQGQAELLWVLEEQLTPLWRLWKFLGEVKPQDMSRCGGDRTRIFCVGRRVLYHYYHQGSPCMSVRVCGVCL